MTPPTNYFEAIADYMGAAYLRYSHTKGTVQEIDWLVPVLGLGAGDRVLDVGCGPGRHSHELARRGILAHGIDVSEAFIELAWAAAPDGATFERADARTWHGADGFDAAISLCQGAFGMMTADGDDERILTNLSAALATGGMLALTAFNAYFVARHHDRAELDAANGIAHELTEVANADGEVRAVDLWTGCYTPRELRLLFDRCGLDVVAISGVEPGAYGPARPTPDTPEFLVIGRRRR